MSRTTAPLKKPLFVPPPPATLDHFFTKADASSSSRPAEIIILNSDSDDDAPVVRAKRKARAHAAESSSSDVEVIETEGSSCSSSGKRFRQVTVDESLHFAEFGRPKLLLNPTEAAAAKCLPEDEPAAAPGDLGVASSDGGSSTSMTACLDNLIEIDDEWGTGDDELIRTKFDDVLELTDDDQVVEDALKVEEDEPPPSANLDQCPFCGRGLTSLSLSSGHTITHQ